MKKRILLGILGAVGYYEYTRYMKLVDSFSIGANNIKLSKSGNLIKVNFNAVFENNSNKSVELNKTQGKLIYMNSVLGTFQSTKKIILKSNSSTNVPMEAFVDIKNFVKRIDITSVNVTSMQLYINSSLNFDVLRVLSLPISISNKITFNIDSFINQLKEIISYYRQILNL